MLKIVTPARKRKFVQFRYVISIYHLFFFVTHMYIYYLNIFSLTSLMSVPFSISSSAFVFFPFFKFISRGRMGAFYKNVSLSSLLLLDLCTTPPHVHTRHLGAASKRIFFNYTFTNLSRIIYFGRGRLLLASLGITSLSSVTLY